MFFKKLFRGSLTFHFNISFRRYNKPFILLEICHYGFDVTQKYKLTDGGK